MVTTSEQVIESIQQLPVFEQEKVWHWLAAKRKPRLAEENWAERTEKFRLALAWLEENRQAYLGQWVCLDGANLISWGADAKEVYADAKAKGCQIPFIEQVQAETTAPFWGGWD